MLDADIRVLESYRQAIQEKKKIQKQIDRTGTTGAPSGLRAILMDGMPRGTNDPSASASQRLDYLEEQMRQWDEQVDAIQERFNEIVKSVKNMRQQIAVRLYYGAGQTYEEAALYMCCSTRTVFRLCRRALEQ